MTRVHLRFARPGMALARAIVAPDGSVVAGVGTRLGPAVVRLLATLGVDSIWVDAGRPVASWEADPPLDEALDALDARFAPEPPDPALALIRACLRERAERRETGRAESEP